MLSRVIVIVAPLYNADGNERISLDHRPEQFGPLGGVGTRENANGLDLNRDFMKLEATESRALVKLLNDWDPHLVIDLHTTNGSYHGYHLTYAPTLAVGADPRIVSFTRDTLLGGATHMHGRPRLAHATSTATSRSRGSSDREQDRPPGPAPARRRGARSMHGRGSSPTASACGIASACSPRRTATCRSSAGSRVTEAFVETLLGQVVAARARDSAAARGRRSRHAAAGSRGTLGPLGTSGRLTPLDGAVPILVGDVETRINPRLGHVR